MTVQRFNDKDSFAASAAVAITSVLNDILASSGQASLFLAGGSTPVPVYKALAAGTGVDWTKIIVGMGDERWAPHNPEMQNALMIADSLYFGGKLRAANFYAIPQLENPAESAAWYDSQIKKTLSGGPADLVLLGIGPDGHTASLFPGFTHPEDALLGFLPAPAPRIEPQVPRISCSYSFLEKAGSVIFLVKTAGKEEVLEKILSGDMSYPAAKVASGTDAQFFLLD